MEAEGIANSRTMALSLSWVMMWIDCTGFAGKAKLNMLKPWKITSSKFFGVAVFESLFKGLFNSLGRHVKAL